MSFILQVVFLLQKDMFLQGEDNTAFLPKQFWGENKLSYKCQTMSWHSTSYWEQQWLVNLTDRLAVTCAPSPPPKPFL